MLSSVPGTNFPPPSGAPPPRIWTTRAKLAGNLLPLTLVAPLMLVGVSLIFRGDAAGVAGYLLCFASLGIGAVSLNWLGLTGNQAMMEALRRRLLPSDDAIFVGVARPSFKNVLDPHEDLGFLVLEPASLTFIGERLRITLAVSDITSVGFKPNPHSVFGLGGWIAVQGSTQGHPITLLIEPRSEPTLRGNKARSAELKRQLEEAMNKVKGQADAKHQPGPSHHPKP